MRSVSLAMSLLLVALCHPSSVATLWASAAPKRDQPSSPIIESAVVPAELTWEVVSRRPHDAGAWTQGLQLDAKGRLFESTGLEGSSSLREVDARTGTIRRYAALPPDIFAEGIALFGDHVIQLTWRDGVAMTWDVETFQVIARHAYEGEGWGLCHDGTRLVMSDGSDRLTFRDAATFEVLGEVEVTLAGEPQAHLNELECVAGDVWANVWLSDMIVRIDPESGAITGVLDLAGILDIEPSAGQAPDVLNGIAWDAEAGTFLVTGKLWPELIEIRVAEPSLPSPTADR